MEFQILHFYPDLMNLYGSYANVSVLARLLERLGHTVTVTAVNPGDFPDGGSNSGNVAKTGSAPDSRSTAKTGGAPDSKNAAKTGGAPDSKNAAKFDAISFLSRADFLYMGAGTERRQRFAMRDFARYTEAVKLAAGKGFPMLFAGTAMELLGASVTTAELETYAGIGLSGFASVQGRRRIVGDVYAHTELFPESVVGFMNKSAVISGIDTPLLDRLELGFGNETEKGPEGFRKGNVFASELTGPILVKNPSLLALIAAAVLKRRGAEVPEPLPLDHWALQGYAVTERELKQRVSS